MSMVLISLIAGFLLTESGEKNVSDRKIQDVSIERGLYADCKKSMAEKNPSMSGSLLLSNHAALCISGEINRSLVSEVAIAIKSGKRKINYVVLSSDGGDFRISLTLAQMIENIGATVIVGDRCVSECAQFSFVAGAKKVILAGGLVLFDGGVTSDEAINNMNIASKAKKALLSEQKKLRKFYRTRDIDIAMLTNPPPEVQEDWKAGKHVMWSWSQEELARFGVRNVYQEPLDLRN